MELSGMKEPPTAFIPRTNIAGIMVNGLQGVQRTLTKLCSLLMFLCFSCSSELMNPIKEIQYI
ncbi:mCG148103, partial [Mus musculus]